MTTWLAELHAEAFDLADPKALADEAVDIHIPHSHLPSSFARPESHLLDDLGGNERQRLARGSSVGVEMAVTFEPLAGDSLDGFDRPKLGLAWSPEMDRLHRHGPIMHEPAVEAGSAERRLGGVSRVRKAVRGRP
jgi:hypothetical protein